MLISRFLTHLKHEKRYSPHTLQAYQSDLQQFEGFMAREFELDLLAVQATHVRSYIMSLLDNQLSANAVGRKLSTLRSFYKHQLRDNLLKVNPMTLVKAPKVPKRLPVFVEDVKMDLLLDGRLDEHGNKQEFFTESFEGQRDKMVIEILFGTGMRLAEKPKKSRHHQYLINIIMKNLTLAAVIVFSLLTACKRDKFNNVNPNALSLTEFNTKKLMENSGKSFELHYKEYRDLCLGEGLACM